MSTNKEEIRPGCIHRIALENFVTYKHVELYPNTSLNLIIGPNGTGKSTFVCAIILGLCGKPNVIGRAKKISEYVRSGCQRATIEIELYRQPGKRNVTITRTFDLHDSTTWYIDGKTARERQVQELVTSLNIQVDNFCQLLPQDRVQDFSEMNPQQLLRSTLSAVGGQASVEQLDELIECRSQQRMHSTRLQNNSQSLEEQVRLNERLKVLIDAMKERKEIENQIEMCEKKKLWLEYQILRQKVVEQNHNKIKAEKIVDAHTNKIKPVESFINNARKNIAELEKQKLSTSREINTLKDKATGIMDSVRTIEYKMKDLEDSLQEKMERHRHREQDLMEARAKLDKLKTDRIKLVEKVGDESHVKMQLADFDRQITKINATIVLLKKQKLEIQYDVDNNVAPQINAYQAKIRKLEDVREERLMTLRASNEDCYKAVMWLRKNKNMFQQPVHEPMLLEINFTDPKFAQYLESTVPNRDLVAFTFESSRDMNLFLQKVRVEGGLKRVNAICSQGDGFTLPKNNIQQLSYLGFYTYLSDTITAPDAIMRYLCKQYSIHRIPIGNQHTYNNSDKVPANITFFFTEKHRFTVRVSAYSGVKSSSTIEIRPASMLANSLDLDQINKLNIQLARFEETLQSHLAKIQDVEGKLSKLDGNLDEVNTLRKSISDNVEKVRTISTQIRLQEKKVVDIEKEPMLDIQQEKERSIKKQKEFVKNQCKLQQELCSIVEKLHGNVMHCELWRMKLEVSRNAIVEQENELREMRHELQNTQVTLENIINLLTRAKSEAKEKLTQAKSVSDNKLPQDKDFPYTREFENLPSDIGELQQHSYELQTKIDCMEEGDEQVFREYEQRERIIARLRTEVCSSSDTNRELSIMMNNIRTRWLPPLEKLMQEINKSFSDMFAKMGCAGEIKLDKGEADDDYDKYGITILVRFRTSEQLQQLTRQAQSGGERALSTAMYLMALQRLTTVPFRCVDEINQGMDPINERKMFELLVQVTTQCDNAQYFLLTPKLLKNLEYNEKIMIHTIMNGKKIMNYKKWDYEKFLENAYKYRP